MKSYSCIFTEYGSINMTEFPASCKFYNMYYGIHESTICELFFFIAWGYFFHFILF